MALDPDIIQEIRDEVGSTQDVTDESPDGPIGNLEDIFNDIKRGNSSTLRTALVVWKRRRADYNPSSFDVTAGGSLMARTQRLRELNRRVKELELLVDTTERGRSPTLNSDYAKAVNEGSIAEF